MRRTLNKTTMLSLVPLLRVCIRPGGRIHSLYSLLNWMMAAVWSLGADGGTNPVICRDLGSSAIRNLNMALPSLTPLGSAVNTKPRPADSLFGVKMVGEETFDLSSLCICDLPDLPIYSPLFSPFASSQLLYIPASH